MTFIKSNFAEFQITLIISRYDQEPKLADLANEHGTNSTTLYNWMAKYGGMSVSELSRLIELEARIRRLKLDYWC